MKLNNRGWGLQSMLIICGIIVLALLFAVMMGEGITKSINESIKGDKVSTSEKKPSEDKKPVEEKPIENKPVEDKTPVNDNNNDNNDNNNNQSSEYSVIEEKMAEAGYEYQQDKYRDLAKGDAITVTIKKLYDLGYIGSMDGCTGYVEIQNISGKIVKNSYIKCNNYQTNGYISQLDKID